MTDLEDARLRWIEEQQVFEEFASLLVLRIKTVITNLGLWSQISHRTKELDSLIKKLMRGKHTYETLPDKVGIRIIVLYRTDVEKVANAVIAALHCGVYDPKTPAPNVVGYLSTHIDWVRLRDTDLEAKRFLVTRFWAELQIRTQAQHLWSEMSHDGFYKNDTTISVLPDDVKRRVNLMAGQIEVADREFDRLRGEQPINDKARLFHFLEPLYYRLTSKRPDSELSLQVIGLLLPLFAEGLPETEQRLTSFFNERKGFLVERYTQIQEADSVTISPLTFQPEAIPLYELLLNDEIALRKAWNRQFPEEILEGFANEMGLSFD